MATKQWRPAVFKRASVSREERRPPKEQTTPTIVIVAAPALAFRDAAQAQALKALDTLVTLAQGATSEAVRVSAANAVLDRAHGRPVPGAKAAADGETSDAGPFEVQWLDAAKS